MAQKYCEMGKHRDARFILSKSNPHAKFLSSHPTHGLIKIISNDEPVSLISGHLNPKIPTVIDSKGRIVTLVHRYLSSLQKKVGVSVSSGTVDQYGGTLSYLCRWIEQSQPYPNLTVDEVLEILDRQDVLSWISAMKKQGIESHKTLHNTRGLFKRIFKLAVYHRRRKSTRSEEFPVGKRGKPWLRYCIPQSGQPEVHNDRNGNKNTEWSAQ